MKLDYRKSHRLEFILIIAGALLELVSLFLDINLLWYAGIAVMLAGVIQAAVFCRCPHCGESLNTRGGLPTYCPDCGKRLE